VEKQGQENPPMNVMVFGIGSSTQAILHILKQHGLAVSTYLMRETAVHSPALEGKTFRMKDYPNPCPLLWEEAIDFVVPMSIDWNIMDWCDEFLQLNIPLLSPTGQGMLIERDRDFARALCDQYGIPFPKSFVARNRLEAEEVLRKHPAGYVIKNPLCSPSSPIHTILCETVDDTRSWLKMVNYEEGVFLQEYMGEREAGHIAFVTGGEIYSLITNQEYKRAFDGNMGVITGAPLGGLVEKDPGDRYHLARELLHPLLPWFREVGYHGPVQVTAMKRDDHWVAVEYNVRIGVTCGPIIMQMLKDPVKVLWDTVNNRRSDIEFHEEMNVGCSLTLAGYGYPYGEVASPSFPVTTAGTFDCDVWWNEVIIDREGSMWTAGQRIADVVAIAPTMEQAVDKAYANIKKIHCSNSYYRTDIGKSKWPPGNP